MVRFLLIAAFSLQPLVSEDVLEPSVQNEVDHAIAVAPADAWAAATNDVLTAVAPAQCCATNASISVDVFGTNGLSATAVALKLGSAQRSDGRWVVGTNDVTSGALRILRDL